MSFLSVNFRHIETSLKNDTSNLNLNDDLKLYEGYELLTKRKNKATQKDIVVKINSKEIRNVLDVLTKNFREVIKIVNLGIVDSSVQNVVEDF